MHHRHLAAGVLGEGVPRVGGERQRDAVRGLLGELLHRVLPPHGLARGRQRVHVEVVEQPAGDDLTRCGRQEARGRVVRPGLPDADHRVEQQPRLLGEGEPGEQVGDTLEESVNSLGSALSNPESLDQAADQFNELQEALRTAADDLDELNPPEDVESAHEDLVDGVRLFADDIEDALAQLSRTRHDLGRIDLRLRAELQKRKPAAPARATG